MDLDLLSRITCQIALEAGEKVLTIYDEEDFSITTKDDDSPITRADLTSHQHITSALQELTPDYPILSEESADIPFSERQHWTTYWLIDPLDGTKEFIKRNDEFSILIALIHHGEPVLGVVHAPALEETWMASLGNGAYKVIGGDAMIPIEVRSQATPPVVMGSRSHADEAMPNFLNAIGEHEYQIMGSIIKACRVAEGQADLYPRLGLTSEWDTAAAHIIVEEAGGTVVQTNGETLRYNTKDSLLNPHFLMYGKDATNWLQYTQA